MADEKKRKKGAKKTFAQQHWRTFEKLSMEIINEIYDEHPGVVSHLTSAQSDGGYDGILCFPSGTWNKTALYKVLLEAKLRSNNKHDLPLDNFSKTVIVAVNTVADKVYISTNAYFSAETIRRLKAYSQRTGLQIRTLDIADITNWITANPEFHREFEDQKLLESLLKMGRAVKPEQNILAQSLSETKTEQTLTEPIIGNERKQLLEQLAQKLKSQNGIVCIQGPAGGGKRVFVNNLAESLQQNYKHISEINLTQFSDARGVFIKLLSIAWGESTNAIFAMSAQDLEEVTEYLGDEQFPQKTREALIDIIHLPQQRFERNRILHSELLLDYLRLIMPPILRRVRSLILIRNVKCATRNALDFLSSFMRVLPNQPVSFLIEVEEHEANSEYFLAEIRETKTYIGSERLPDWDHLSAREFISKAVPWLPEPDQDALIRFFGYLPLALATGINAFCHSETGEMLSTIRTTLPDGPPIDPSYTLGYIEHIVLEFATSGGDSVQSGLALLGIFDGAVKIKMLEDVSSALGQASPIPALCMWPILRTVDGQIQVSHGAYLSSISKMDFIGKPLLYETLRQVEMRLEEYYQDSDYVLKKRFEILCLCRCYDHVRDLWMPLAANYMQRGERHLTYKVLKVIYDWWLECLPTTILTPFEQYWLLFHLTRTAYSLYGADSSELWQYREQLDTLINQAENEIWEQPSSMRHAKADICHTKSQIALGQADYQKMLDYAEQGIALVEDDLTTRGLDCLGALWADKALALKHLYNIAACLEFLESGKERLDGVRPFMHCYYTHLSSKYSVSDPKRALEFFELTQKLYNQSLSEILHTDHNIATMYFVLGEYKRSAEICGRVWSRAYEYHIPIEKGRSEHLLGCIAWVNNHPDKAYQHFEAAYNLFQRHIHRTHTWPPLINLVTLSMEMGLVGEALAYADDAIEFLLQYHRNNILHMDASSHPLPKIYVGLLLLLECLYSADETGASAKMLLDKIDLAILRDAYEQYIVPHQLDVLLDNSGYICGGKRMLKV